MRLNKYIVSTVMGILLIFTSCSDFLDQVPDNRAEIVTPLQVKKLLINAYPEANYAVLTELSSDNFVDNNSPDEKGVYFNLSSYSRMDDEIFAWEPVKSSTSQDSPSFLWSANYLAIATVNHALEAIEKIEKNNESLSNSDRTILNAAKAEAFLIRAYAHFVLVNVFCQPYRDENLSNNPTTAQGIPYVTTPETTVYVHYDRGTVAGVYAKIQEDLENGLALMDGGYVVDTKIPKYHFNKLSAHAFAARFYLYKREYDKVIEHANLVLGSNPAASMRNWRLFDGIITTDAFALEWANADSPSNLFLLSTVSDIYVRPASGSRYQCNRTASSETIMSFLPTWTSSPQGAFKISGLSVAGKQEYGMWSAKLCYFIEWTNKTAGTGYRRAVLREFTAEETLLCRAEAYVYKNEFGKAVEDLQVWNASRQDLPATYGTDKEPLTEDAIRSYYKGNANKETAYAKFYNNEKLSPNFIITPEQKPFINCVLHIRRLETIFDGLRWFDIKRYGIEIEHAIGKTRVEKLTWDDPRRAIQLPQEAIASGLEANIRAINVAIEQAKDSKFIPYEKEITKE